MLRPFDFAQPELEAFYAIAAKVAGQALRLRSGQAVSKENGFFQRKQNESEKRV